MDEDGGPSHVVEGGTLYMVECGGPPPGIESGSPLRSDKSGSVPHIHVAESGNLLHMAKGDDPLC